MARLPCVSHPGTHPNPTCQIKTTPIHKGSEGFQLTLSLKQGAPTGYGGRYANSASGILFKHNGSATENDNYTFSSA